MKSDHTRNKIDLIVGLPSFMEADTIGYVTRQVDIGLQKYFKGMRSIIVNVDNNSEDDTKGAFLSIPTETPKKYITTPKYVRGKGVNFLNLFKLARKHFGTLKAVAVFDTDLRSITPEWVKYMAEPVIKGYDYAVPRYSRHQFDGTITNHICHPVLYGLLGENIRQPIGGDFGISPAMVDHMLRQKWLPTTKLYGIDIFMTLSAITGKYRVCEVGLGAKIHKASAPKLGPMFTQVVTTLFETVLSRKSEWINTPIKDPVMKPQFGLRKLDPPLNMTVNLGELKEKLRDEFASREKSIRKYLSSYLFHGIRRMIEHDSHTFNTLMWTQTVYHFLHAFDISSPKAKRDVIEALKPLHLARSITFDQETYKHRIDFAEELIFDQAMAFASQKPYFRGLYENVKRY